MYGAIFSDPEVYNCQIKRLMKRASNLAEIYKSKAQYLDARGCGAIGLSADFNAYQSQINAFVNLNEPNINIVESFSENLGDENELLTCKIF